MNKRIETVVVALIFVIAACLWMYFLIWPYIIWPKIEAHPIVWETEIERHAAQYTNCGVGLVDGGFAIGGGWKSGKGEVWGAKPDGGEGLIKVEYPTKSPWVWAMDGDGNKLAELDKVASLIGYHTLNMASTKDGNIAVACTYSPNYGWDDKNRTESLLGKRAAILILDQSCNIIKKAIYSIKDLDPRHISTAYALSSGDLLIMGFYLEEADRNGCFWTAKLNPEGQVLWEKDISHDPELVNIVFSDSFNNEAAVFCYSSDKPNKIKANRASVIWLNEQSDVLSRYDIKDNDVSFYPNLHKSIKDDIMLCYYWDLINLHMAQINLLPKDTDMPKTKKYITIGNRFSSNLISSLRLSANSVLCVGYDETDRDFEYVSCAGTLLWLDNSFKPVWLYNTREYGSSWWLNTVFKLADNSVIVLGDAESRAEQYIYIAKAKKPNETWAKLFAPTAHVSSNEIDSVISWN